MHLCRVRCAVVVAITAVWCAIFQVAGRPVAKHINRERGLLTACIEDMLNVDFDYPLETTITLTDSVKANVPVVVESEVIEVKVIEEMTRTGGKPSEAAARVGRLTQMLLERNAAVSSPVLEKNRAYR